jgi:hypothetical protein
MRWEERKGPGEGQSPGANERFLIRGINKASATEPLNRPRPSPARVHPSTSVDAKEVITV